jgi:hypothetical protein
VFGLLLSVLIVSVIPSIFNARLLEAFLMQQWLD